jgi:hypothetical protein
MAARQASVLCDTLVPLKAPVKKAEVVQAASNLNHLSTL